MPGLKAAVIVAGIGGAIAGARLAIPAVGSNPKVLPEDVVTTAAEL